jgi:DNA modification methylase
MQKLLNRIISGDCIEILGTVKEPFADLIFADPPFNIGYKYDKYNDKQKKDRYVAWTRDWMTACKKILKPNGSFYIAIGDDYAANVKIIADELGLFMRNWIIWHYTFGQQTKDKFARSHTHILYFVKDKKNFTFNDYAVRVPSDRQLTYNDKRANPAGKMPDDVWTQYPLLKRIIAASSNYGDCVLDPFSGSATTAAAAIQLGRNYIGVEISPEYVKAARKRLTQLKKQRATSLFFNAAESNELKQLLYDMERPAKEIVTDNNLLELFTNQFAVRMNNQKHYTTEKIVAALEDLSG